jgi:hypothetical protein
MLFSPSLVLFARIFFQPRSCLFGAAFSPTPRALHCQMKTHLENQSVESDSDESLFCV